MAGPDDDDFFPHWPAPPRPEGPREQPVWWGPPRDELGRGVAFDDVLLARGDDLALLLSAGSAFSTGFGFRLVAVARPGTERWEPIWSERELRQSVPDDALQVAVEFSDGRRAFDKPPWVREENPSPERPVLRREGSHGHGAGYEISYWAWPLPPPGPLTFVCRWRAQGVPLSRHTMDAGPILEAAARVQRIWDG